ncbi:calcium-binding protein [Sphingopyxis sp.]|jgi:hypothetical protein|uniref:calcium-binding protein n=1 Tax=Sphingopyxis sp. TaxID=1908224 RepID=UPI003F71E112
MLKQMLLIGAAAVSFPALAQTTPPAADPAAPTTAAEPAPMSDTAPPTDPATTPAPAPDASAPPAATEAAPAAGTAATPTQIAQIVDKEFPTYDADANGDLNNAEFAAWMKKLRTATDPSVDPESADVKTWIGQAFAAADGDKSGAVNKTELTGFLSRGA